MNRKITFLIIPIFVLTLSLFRYPVVLAQTTSSASSTQTGSTVISDYAKDVQEGEKDTANDQDAQNNQKGAKENENTEGKEEGENTNINEQVEHQEAVEPKEVENESGGDGSSVNSDKQGSNQESKSEERSKEVQSKDSSKESGDNKQE